MTIEEQIALLETKVALLQLRARRARRHLFDVIEILTGDGIMNKRHKLETLIQRTKDFTREETP